jgi:hypothetical protein
MVRDPKRSGALVPRLMAGLALLGWPRMSAAQGTWSVISLSQKPGEVTYPLTVAVDRAANVCVAEGYLNSYGTAHCTRANTTERERAGVAFHFIHADYAAEESEKIVAPDRSYHPLLTGPRASGGLQEYGVRVAGTWEQEIARPFAVERLNDRAVTSTRVLETAEKTEQALKRRRRSGSGAPILSSCPSVPRSFRRLFHAFSVFSAVSRTRVDVAPMSR